MRTRRLASQGQQEIRWDDQATAPGTVWGTDGVSGEAPSPSLGGTPEHRASEPPALLTHECWLLLLPLAPATGIPDSFMHDAFLLLLSTRVSETFS